VLQPDPTSQVQLRLQLRFQAIGQIVVLAVLINALRRR